MPSGYKKDGSYSGKIFKKDQIGYLSGGWRGGKEKIICLYCKKEFYVIKSRIIKKTVKFCSMKCRNKFRTGVLAPNWKDGIYLKNPKEYKKLKQSKRNAIKKNSKGNFSFSDWERMKQDYNYTCPCCGKKEPEIQLTIDHIKSLSNGGGHIKENMQPLCLSCNCKKHTKTILYHKGGR